MERAQVNVRLSDDFLEELETLARRRRLNLSELCRQLMESSLKDHPGRLRDQLIRALDTAASLLVRAEKEDLVFDEENLVDDLDDLRSDLEENPDSDDEPDSGEESEEEEDSDEERT